MWWNREALTLCRLAESTKENRNIPGAQVHQTSPQCVPKLTETTPEPSTFWEGPSFPFIRGPFSPFFGAVLGHTSAFAFPTLSICQSGKRKGKNLSYWSYFFSRLLPWHWLVQGTKNQLPTLGKNFLDTSFPNTVFLSCPLYPELAVKLTRWEPTTCSVP